MRILPFAILFFFGSYCTTLAQTELEENEAVFSLTEFLALVKKHHPVVSQANLKLSEAEAKLLKARGAFDPTLTGGLKEKNYKGTEYYELWDGQFKIPLWYGVDVKAGYEQTEGYYLNPQNNTPDNGLFSAGISINLLQGMIYNERMNTVRKAKLLQDQYQLKRNLQVNDIIAKAAKAYVDWVYYHQNNDVFEAFLENARIRFQGVVESTEIGETSAIDTVESKIPVNKRKLQLQENELNLQKARLYLSSFLWVNDVPIQISQNLRPSLNNGEILDALQIEQVLGNAQEIEGHPKLQILDNEIQQNTLDIRLSQNNLLPDINLEYNFINETISDDPVWNTQNYKAGISLKFPIFLRKQRGELRLSKIQRDRNQLKRNQKRWDLINKVKATERALISLNNQIKTAQDVVDNNQKMTAAEIRLFDMGESSIFLINTRENRLIQARLKENSIQQKYYDTAIKLFSTLGLNFNNNVNR